jgi:hypothetical protein
MPKKLISECTCGHLQSQHEDSNVVGHGACTLCGCEQFTWSSFNNQWKKEAFR